MASLLRIARQSELAHEGQKLVKEVYGRKILLARTGGQVYATDAHCYHMGGNLWEGDIEDIDGHACIRCPLHHYRIDMSTGQKVDRMLDGCVTCSSSQQQRTYKVFVDSEFIRIDIPELHTQQTLPSDRYNQVLPQPACGTPGRGLFGSSGGGRGLAAAEPLAPFAGFGARSLVPGTPEREAAEEPALMLSQEAPQAAQQQQQQQPAQYAQQGHINFPQARRETAWSMRRKIATEAIKKNAYKPPSAPMQQPAQPAARGLFSGGAAPAQQQQPAQRQGGLARTTSGGGQQSLFAFGFTQQARAVAASEAEDMEM